VIQQRFASSAPADRTAQQDLASRVPCFSLAVPCRPCGEIPKRAMPIGAQGPPSSASHQVRAALLRRAPPGLLEARPAERPAHLTVQVVVKSHRDWSKAIRTGQKPSSLGLQQVGTGSVDRPGRAPGQCAAPAHAAASRVANSPALFGGSVARSAPPFQHRTAAAPETAPAATSRLSALACTGQCIQLCRPVLAALADARSRHAPHGPGPACGLRCARRLHAARGRGSGPHECACKFVRWPRACIACPSGHVPAWAGDRQPPGGVLGTRSGWGVEEWEEWRSGGGEGVRHSCHFLMSSSMVGWRHQAARTRVRIRHGMWNRVRLHRWIRHGMWSD
jgi:hypothetical protein